jgi:signal transduction histidine kinase
MRGIMRSAWAVAVVVGAVMAAGALTGIGRERRVPLPADLGAAAAAALAIGLSTVAPVPVLVVCTIAEAGYLLAGWGTPALLFGVVAGLYQLATKRSTRVSWAAALVCGGACWAAAGLGSADGWWSAEGMIFFAVAGMSVAVGEAVRNRRAYVAEVEDRARRAELSREDEVRRRVGEERLRIARELHDVVAHHISVINVQAGAAAYALTRQPEAARQPLSHIRQASTTVLKELTSIVGLLRQPGDQDSNEPQPGIGQVPGLLESFTAAGVRIEFATEGEPIALPASADLAAYRITQEALTNARKHGDGGPVRVRFAYGRDRLVVEISNGVPGYSESETEAGYGLVGMRERAIAAGGTVEAALDGDRFTVRAVLKVAA